MKDEVINRNPSPPPEYSDQSDNEENGIISSLAPAQEQFLLETLIDVLKDVENEKNQDGEDGDEVESPEPEELDENLETRLCQLWDLSVDEKISAFLLESEFLDTSFAVTLRTNKPRLVEICLGVWGNILSSQKCCESLSQDDSEILARILTSALGFRDAPSLEYATKALNLALDQKLWSAVWENHFVHSQNWNDIIFIFSSSSNIDLLLWTSKIADTILDSDFEAHSVKSEVILKLDESVDAVLDALTESQSHIGPMTAAAVRCLYSLVNFRSEIPAEKPDNRLRDVITILMAKISSAESIEDMEASIITTIVAILGSNKTNVCCDDLKEPLDRICKRISNPHLNYDDAIRSESSVFKKNALEQLRSAGIEIL